MAAGLRGGAAYAVASALVLTLRTGVAQAQATYGSAPIGGRSALMGGTGIALGRDGAGPFLNPATMGHIDDSGVAFSVNFYSFQSSHLSGFHQPGPVDANRYGALSLPNTSLDTSRVDALPSTLCLFLTIGPWGDKAPIDQREPRPHRKGHEKLAACIASPERMQLSATAQAYAGDSVGLHASQALSVSQFWNRVYVGPSYSIYVSDDVAVGASLFGVGTIASSTWSIDTLVQDTLGNGVSSAYDTGASAYSVDLAAVLGLLWHIDDRQVLGLSLSTPSLHALGHYQGTTSLQAIDATSNATLTTSSGDYQAPPPMRIGVGLGGDLGTVRVEGDATAYIPVVKLASANVATQQTTLVGRTTSSNTIAQSLTVPGRPIVDAALGIEGFLSPTFSLLAGASTDLSALQPLPSSPEVGTLAESRMNRVTASFGIGSYGDGSELLLGTQLSYGWGQSIAVNPYVSPPSLALVDQKTFGAMIVVAGGVSLSAFKRTLKDLGNVVRLPAPKR
jgi:hypothetical protein